MNPALGHEVERSTGDAGNREEEGDGDRRRAGRHGVAITAAKRGHDVTVFDKAGALAQPVCVRHQPISRAPMTCCR